MEKANPEARRLWYVHIIFLASRTEPEKNYHINPILVFFSYGDVARIKRSRLRASFFRKGVTLCLHGIFQNESPLVQEGSMGSPCLGGGFSNTGALPGRYTNQYGGVEPPRRQDLADTQNINIHGAYGAGKNSFRANIFGNRAGNHFLYEDYYGYARRKEGNEVWDLGASLAWVRDVTDYSTLILSAAAYYGDKNIPLSGYTSEAAKERDFSTRQNVMLDMPRVFRDDLAMEAFIGHSWQTLNYDPGRGASLHKEQSITAVTRWSWYPRSKLTPKAGGDYRYAYIDSTNDGLHIGHRGGIYLNITVSQGIGKNITAFGSLRNILNTRYVSFADYPMPGLTFTVGLRMNFEVPRTENNSNSRNE
jgi:hypothetical protein